jgi:hypothetical protein
LNDGGCALMRRIAWCALGTGIAVGACGALTGVAALYAIGFMVGGEGAWLLAAAIRAKAHGR